MRSDVFEAVCLTAAELGELQTLDSNSIPPRKETGAPKVDSPEPDGMGRVGDVAYALSRPLPFAFEAGL